MNDILNDIKGHVDDGMSINTARLLEDAAEEIERLRKALEQIESAWRSPSEMLEIARKALCT